MANYFFVRRVLVGMVLAVVIGWAPAAGATDVTFTPNVGFGPGGKQPITIRGCAAGQQCVNEDLGKYIASLYRYGIGLAAALATIMIMIGGFVWLTSAGSSDKVGRAKEYITAALTGLLLALFSYMILFLINPKLVSFEPVRITGASVPADTGTGANTGSGTGSVSAPGAQNQPRGVDQAQIKNRLRAQFDTRVTLPDTGDGNQVIVISDDANRPPEDVQFDFALGDFEEATRMRDVFDEMRDSCNCTPAILVPERLYYVGQQLDVDAYLRANGFSPEQSQSNWLRDGDTGINLVIVAPRPRP